MNNRLILYFRTRMHVFYGLVYFLLIPIFALVYFLQLPCSFKTDLHIHNFITCLYFSTVTITTLGFGDISPVSITAQVSVIIESITGLFMIGLFLNALAQAQSARITFTERTAATQIQHRQHVIRLLRFDKIIQLSIHDYDIYAWAMTTTTEQRQVEGAEMKVRPDFAFKDMADLFGPSLLGADMLEPVINIFFKKLFLLVADIKSLLVNVDLEAWPRLEEACHRFLENCNAVGIAEGLIEQGKNEALRKVIIDHILKEKDDPEYYNYGHIINPVIVIYKLIKENQIFLEEYKQFIERVKSEEV